MKQSTSERNKTALLILVFSLLTGSFVSFTGWSCGLKSMKCSYYENVQNSFLGILFLLFAFLIILIPYIYKRKIKNRNKV